MEAILMHSLSNVKYRHEGDTWFMNDGFWILGYIALRGGEYEVLSIGDGT
jgi:hypothetical protein